MNKFPLIFLLVASTVFGQYGSQPPSTADVTTTGKFTADTIVADAVSVTSTTHGNMGATEEFDAAVGFHTGTLNANCSITIINWPLAPAAATITLAITQNATGYFNITGPTGIVSSPQVDPGPSHVTFITYLSFDGGTTVYAFSDFSGLNAALPVDDTYSGTTITGLNAGATITQWQVVYLNSSSKWVLADADGSGTYPARGIAVTAGTDGNPLTVLTQGTIRNDGWSAWTVGGQLYLSETAGAITQTAPSNSEQIGVASAAKTIYVDFGSAGATAPSAGSSKMILSIGGVGSSTADGTVYLSPAANGAGVEGDASYVMPFAGTLKNLNLRTSTLGVTGTPVTVVTVRKNKVDTTLLATMNQTNETTTTDSTHTVSFAAGDRLTVSVLTTGTIAISNVANATIEYDAL